MANRDFEIEPRAPKRKFFHFKDLILHEDEQVIVVNKPAGVASLEDREDRETNLLKWGRNYFAGLQLCHRLDKGTSGAIVFAKDPEAYRFINLQFQEREVVKHYFALVMGVRRFEEFVIDAPLGLSGTGKARVDFGGGKDAVTIVDTEEVFRDQSLVSCQPLTGRTHQIRAHLSSAGCPIIGDSLYGGEDLFLSRLKKNYRPKPGQEEKPVNEGMLLHARGIQLTLPGGEEPSRFVAPLSKNFEVTLKILRKYGN